MSHILKEDWALHNLDALWLACAALGLQAHKNQKHHRWYGAFLNDSTPNMTRQEIQDFGKCEHAISVPDSSYDIGVYKNKDKEGYYLAFDHYGTGHAIENKLGMNLEKLKQEYTKQLMKLQAKKHGHQFKSVALPNGKVAVTITV